MRLFVAVAVLALVGCQTQPEDPDTVLIRKLRAERSQGSASFEELKNRYSRADLATPEGRANLQRTSSVEFWEFLIQEGLDPNEIIEIPRSIASSALDKAALDHNPDLIAFLLKHGANTSAGDPYANAILVSGGEFWTPSREFALLSAEMIRELHSGGWKPAPSAFALEMAVLNYQPVLSALVKAGADPKKIPDVIFLCMGSFDRQKDDSLSVRAPYFPNIDFLIAQGIDLNVEKDGLTPLQKAQKDLMDLKDLFGRGVKITAPSEFDYNLPALSPEAYLAEFEKQVRVLQTASAAKR